LENWICIAVRVVVCDESVQELHSTAQFAVHSRDRDDLSWNVIIGNLDRDGSLSPWKRAPIREFGGRVACRIDSRRFL